MSAHFLSEELRGLKADLDKLADDDDLAGGVVADIQGRLDHYIMFAFNMEQELAVFRLMQQDKIARAEAERQAAEFMASSILSAEGNVLRPKFRRQS